MADISLPNMWSARSYQRPFFNHMFEGGQFPSRKRGYAVWHRRAGKDSCMVNLLAVASQMRIGTFWHLLPTLNQGRKVVWNGVDAKGRRVIDQAFPQEMVAARNENEMTLKLHGGSFYQVVGSDNYNSLVGTNPIGVIFSEWALADPACWAFVRPILAENDGFAIFITTPRGKNHAHDLWRTAQGSPNWFTSRLTVDDTFRDDGTRVITQESIDMEREEGVPEELIQQEYYCSFEGVNQGSIYGSVLNRHASTNQIHFPEDFNPDLPVHTAWDLGRRDATAVWFYQLVRDEVHIIDYREYLGMHVDDVLDELKTYPYAYGIAALPHDAKARTFSSKYTTYERFLHHKFQAYVCKMIPREQGINAGRTLMKDVFFNVASKNVNTGLDRLAAYQYEWDPQAKVFKSEPLHNHASNGADAYRMLSVSVNVIAGATKNRNTTTRHRVMTPMGPALRLDTLFAEREAARKNLNVRV